MGARKEKYDGPRRGLLDLLDIAFGRLSDSDSSQPGKRKRSWGATVMFFCMIPSFSLVFAVTFQVVYSTVRTPEEAAVQTAPVGKTPPKGRRKPAKVGKASTPINYIGWPIVALAGGILLVGASFALIRRDQDLTRALQIVGAVAEVKNGTTNLSSSTHTMLEDTLHEALGKVTGNGKKKNAGLADDEIPIEPIAEEWAERRKQS